MAAASAALGSVDNCQHRMHDRVIPRTMPLCPAVDLMSNVLVQFGLYEIRRRVHVRLTPSFCTALDALESLVHIRRDAT